ncbi:choline ABC transporter permease subunit [Rhizobium lusitanum]|uniref:Glycine betaine/proline transport system permease protein n=1 Tax=Rhizobium lusitanum TaxID=293958 RepID=A0A7X0MAZ8_9HYPH|nr:choline ABC transporter permease subunit [Rhizobium lusitanum]MBB6484237.1 glycine betaine/proline transport system permease protein [Rhizobium lusitanum]
MNWLTDYRLPIGPWAKAAVDWLTTNFIWFFDGLAFVVSHGINGLLFLLQAPHPLIVVAVFAAIAYWMRRSVSIAALTLVGFLVTINQGYWKETTETLALVLASTFVCMLVGVPLGIAAARRPWLYAIMRPILDLMQTIPTFVYLVPAMILLGLGMVPGLVATVVFAIPAAIRMTRLGIISTPPSLVEAAEAFGATQRQVLRKIELPFAAPQIMAGLTQTIMLSLSMVSIAALVGAPGLGVPVLRGLQSVNVGKSFDSGSCIVILAIVLDRMFRAPGEGDRS